jgi:hypothetical protein
MSDSEKPRAKGNSKAGVKRAVEWVEAAGIEIGAVEFPATGGIKILAKSVCKDDSADVLATPNPWD